VRLHLTKRGARHLATLAAAHLDELKRLEPALIPRFATSGEWVSRTNT
jgi:hypothetical protein